MKHHILIGTYHKTGSVWMGNVFKALAKKLGVPFYSISAHTKFYKSKLKSPEGVSAFLNQLAQSTDYAIVFDDHSVFGDISSDNHHAFKGVRLVRPPVSVICSSAKYHLWAEEAWLHKPMSRFSGKTYQESIKALSSMNECYRFEMENSARKTIKQMAGFHSWPFFRVFEFEVLMKDTAFINFTRMFSHLGLEKLDVIKALKVVYQYSTFGEVNEANSAHIQSSGDNAYGMDWDGETVEKFLDGFSGDARSLGFSVPEFMAEK